MAKKNLTLILSIIVLVLLFVLYFVYRQTNVQKNGEEKLLVDDFSDKIVLTYATHWSQENQANGIYDENGNLKYKGLKHYLDEYTVLNPEIKFNIQVIPYTEYADTLRVLSEAGLAPDIYQIYSPWGVSYVRNGMLDKLPEDIKSDVLNNYVSVSGVTIDGEMWGIPTEVNNFSLLYNKELFKEAGLVDSSGNVLYPRTWTDFVDKAVKLTKKDESGNIIQYGVAFLGEDWQVVDPFLSLLYSNGGEFISSDYSKSLFNSSKGVEALEALLELFEKEATDVNGNFYDFKDDKVAMVISPPWPKATFAEAFGSRFENVVGVAPFPRLKSQATSGYSWFMGVMSGSQNKEEAWKFLKWFSSDLQTDSNTTRYGDLLANNIGAIPSREVDFNSHEEILGDFFTGVYVEQMTNAVFEPNIADSSRIKAVLMEEIMSAWSGEKTAKQALDNAAEIIDSILLSNLK